MRIGFISDIHVRSDDNIPEVLRDVSIKKNIDLLIIAGDLTSHYKNIPKIIERILDGTSMDLRFIPGNHDLYRQGGGSSLEAYEKLLKSPYNLITNPIVEKYFVIFGDTGWYDYSYNPNGYTDKELEKKVYGMARWADKTYFNWDGASDQFVSEFFLNRLKNNMEMYSDKEMIVVTHTVPFEKFVTYKGDPYWDYFSAFIGSSKYGELYKKYGVKKCVFGHTHTRYHEMNEGVECICRPLGNIYELEGKDLYEEMMDALFVIEY